MGDKMNYHKDLEKYLDLDLEKYLPDIIKKLNKLLHDKDYQEYQHEHGNTNFLCNLYGDCAATESEIDKPDFYVSNCFFCGAELITYKGNYYHYSAFHDMNKFYSNYKRYNTHNYQKLTFGVDPVSEEQRTLIETEEKIQKLIEEIKKYDCV